MKSMEKILLSNEKTIVLFLASGTLILRRPFQASLCTEYVYTKMNAKTNRGTFKKVFAFLHKEGKHFQANTEKNAHK